MYEREALHQLRDRKCYKRLTFNLLTSFNNSLQLILDEALLYNTITKDQRHLLTVECPRVPCLYLLPKVHKDEKIPPGRPIVSDSTDLLLRLEGITLEEDMWMVSLDVESLYTSIRHEDGLQAVRYFLSMSSLGSKLINFLMEVLEFALSHNFFLFKEIFYLQLQGTATGAAFAPSYANLFLGLWDRQVLLTDTTEQIEKVLLWTRFIDDIFLIWQGTEGDLKKFVDYLNMNSLNIKLTSHHSQVSMDFLNLNIYRKMDNSLHTKIFRKPTAVNALLSAQSSHPQSLIKKTYQWDNSCDYGETVPRIRFSENKREN
ncbi:uncharacterized protein ACNLHF_022024 isoform 1-T1 [Anomaloglossus baeobatrachus]